MDDLLENLRKLERELENQDYEIDHYEIRERREDYSLGKGIEDGGAARATGPDPLRVLEEWETIDSEEYVIEVFLGGRNPLDRVIYDPETGESDYLRFSGENDESVDRMLEETG